MQNETLTNVFWGLFLIWFGVVAGVNNGDFAFLVNGSKFNALFGLGSGVLLLLLNLLRTSMRLKMSILTIGLGVILVIFYAPQLFLGVSAPFLPTLIIIVGAALIIGALRARSFF